MHRRAKIRLAGLALTAASLLCGGWAVAAARLSSHPVHRHPVHRHRAVHRRRRYAPLQLRNGTSRPAPTPDPSGVPMPTGSPRGWREVFSDDFSGSSLDWQWTAYRGRPGGDPGGFFDPAHVTVSGGQLVISAYRDPADNGSDAGPSTYVTGGISSSPSFAQTYGKYLVRFRMDPGRGIALAVLLWPQTNTWPPEIDFAEDNGSDRQTNYATLHFGAGNTQVQRTEGVNLTQWHTLGVQWTPGKLVYTLDGGVWADVTNTNVPSVPMVLDIQTQGWACGTSTWEQCPNAGTPSRVNLDVAWVVAYAPS